MTTESDDRPHLSGDDARFVERLASHYAPEPLTEARRAAFDARLRERLEERSPRLTLIPALVAVCVTAVLVWATLPLWTENGPLDRSSRSVVAQEPSVWEERLLYGDAAVSIAEEGAAEELPSEYAAIASVLLDG